MSDPLPTIEEVAAGIMAQKEAKAEEVAISYLRRLGYGVISPTGDCLGNVGFFPDGSMVVSTNRKPVYGLLSVHQAVADG